MNIQDLKYYHELLKQKIILRLLKFLVLVNQQFLLLSKDWKNNLAVNF